MKSTFKVIFKILKKNYLFLKKANIDKKKEELYQLWRARQRRLKTTRA